MNTRISSALSHLFAGLLLLAAPAFGQSAVFDECGNPRCEVDTIDISTGYDHLNAELYDPVAADFWWTLVESPNTDLVVPSPAWVIEPHSAWSTLPGAGWLSAYSTSAFNQNNWAPADPYSFERCFCVCEPTDLRIVFDLLIDNVGDVYLDNTLIASQTDTSTASFQEPLSVDVTVPVAAGEHCLRVELRNLSGIAMGFSLAGSITSSPPGTPIMLSPLCCTDEGKLIVCKFKDADCNGVKDFPAQPMSGVTFTLQPGNHVATTDAAGYAYFTVPAGDYTLVETPPPGWTFGTPAGGTLPVTIEAGTVQSTEFLNCPTTGTVTVCKFLDADCDGIKDIPSVPLADWGFIVSPDNFFIHTSASGYATITLEAGTYTITEKSYVGWEPSNPASGSMTVVVTAGSSQTIDFLNCPTLGLLAVYKLKDTDCNGTPDVSGAAVADWLFEVQPSGDSGATDENGCVMFMLPAGTYTVSEELVAGWTAKSPASGSASVTVVNGQTTTVTFINCPPWVSYEEPGTPGTNGLPTLDVIGDPAPLNNGCFEVADALPFHPIWFVISFAPPAAIPFHCGLLAAFPPQLLFVNFTDVAGFVKIPFVWPALIPSGVTITVQALFPDPGAPCGWAMTNAMTTTTP